MPSKLPPAGRAGLIFGFATGLLALTTAAFADSSNLTVRLLAANLTSGNNQRYETPGLDIFKGLKPDIVCLQEFNYASTNGLGINTTAALRQMIDATFGTNYSFFREPGYAIPNGIISRYPIVSSGSWDDGDANINDRGFAWAQIHLPGTNDLYAVSIHLKASSGATNELRRAAQVAVLKSLIQANFPSNAWIVVGGDCNTYSQTEPCMTALTSFLSDASVPVDQASDPDTNAGRTQRYDRVMPSFSFTNAQVQVVIGANTFANGLVFDSRVYSPLSDVSPVLATDSGAAGMQHMGVIKDFQITVTFTNTVAVPRPILVMTSPQLITWTGLSNVTYTIETTADLPLTNWFNLGTVTSSTTNFSFTNSSAGDLQRYFRVTSP